MTEPTAEPDPTLALLDRPASRLIRAAEASDLVALNRALADGADPNVGVLLTIQDPATQAPVWTEDRRPLIQALRFDLSESLAHRLLDVGACPNRVDTNGQTPVSVAIAEHRWSVVERLIHEQRIIRIDDLQALLDAAITGGRVTLVRYSLDRPYWSEPSFQDAQVLRPSCDAASTPVHRLLNAWLYEGADATHVAALRAVLDLLLEHRPWSSDVLNQTASAFSDETPLAQAVRIGDLALLHRLLDTGADPNGRFSNHLGVQVQARLNLAWSDPGWTPLHLAASLDHFEVLQALIERGAQEDVRTVYAVTPDAVHRRFRAGDDVVADLVALRPGCGLTPLDVAQRDHAVRCRAWLEQRTLRASTNDNPEIPPTGRPRL